MIGLPGVSIVIPNHNYGRFLGAAIGSGLAQDHPQTEIIVVDDGSTDESREVILSFADRIRAVYQPNQGHVAACTNGWLLARHPILIFLDSDDLLEPHAASTVARAFAPGVVKVQFPMTTIDSLGQSLNHVAPKYPRFLDTKTIRHFILSTGASPSTPGSGNAYAKSLLEQVFPIENTEGLGWMDPVLETNAPFYGEVVTLREPLARYRMHGANNYLGEVVNAERFVRYVDYFQAKLRYIDRRRVSWGVAFDPESARRHSIWYVECQMAASALMSPSDPRRVPPLRVLVEAILSATRSPYGLRRRAILVAWLAAVAIAPRRLAEELIAYRFVVARRPHWFERALRIFVS